jgi:hypothetical protein
MAEPVVGATRIDWLPVGDSEHLVLTVAGPEGFWLRREVEAGQSASLSLSDPEWERLPDGTYTWELRAVSLPGTSERSLVESGHFFVKDGSFVPARKKASATPQRKPRLITAESHINDDLSVTGNVCIGTSCTSADPDPNLPSLILKGPQPHIRFDDQFVEGGSTPHDWAVFINPSSAAEFSIADVENQLFPFTIAGGAPNSSVYVASNGNVGLGTATPGTRFHVSSSNGSTLQPAALIEETNGTTAFRTMLELKNNGASRLNFTDSFTGNTWGINNNNGNVNMIRSGTGGLLAFSLQPNGTLTVVDVNESSDRDMKTDIVAVQPEDILTKVSRLPLATWRFKNDEDKATHLGPMAQDFSAIFGLGHDDKHIKPLDVAGVSLAAVQALHQMFTESTNRKDEEIAQLRRENADLAQRLAALEALVLQSRRADGTTSDMPPTP